MSDNKKTVMALGYFDSVHKGHRLVIQTARELANKLNANCVVFTFKGNLKQLVDAKDGTFVYSDEERGLMYKDLGADDVCFAPVNYEFLSMGKLAFLNMLNREYEVIGYVCGNDYSFGKHKSGSIKDLKNYASKRSQEVVVVDSVNFNDEKISTTLVKKHLREGNLELVKEFLGHNYSITSTVVNGRGVGKDLGFPTANVLVDEGRVKLKRGVYEGKVFLDEKCYNAVVNYGIKPTFNLTEISCEAFLIDFKGDLYGKKVRVEFVRYIREEVRFSSREELISQIKKDVLEVQNGNN